MDPVTQTEGLSSALNVAKDVVSAGLDFIVSNPLLMVPIGISLLVAGIKIFKSALN